MSKHVMIDLETWGKGPNAQIISIGAVKFDPHNMLGPWDNFHVAVDPGRWNGIFGLASPFETDPSTVMWWMQPGNDQARAHWLRSEKLDIATTLAGFAEWFGPDSLPVWGNGATFDNVILSHAFKACGMERPWSYQHDRCYRTLRNLFPAIKGPSDTTLREWLASFPENEGGEVGVPHTALYDAQWQTMHLLSIFDRMVPEPIRAPVPEADHEKIAATTEADIARHEAEDDRESDYLPSEMADGPLPGEPGNDEAPKRKPEDDPAYDALDHDPDITP